jgi:HK97 gp10 family phage protein
MGATLRSDLPKLAAGAQAFAELALAKLAFDLEGEAKRRAPVDTGFLRTSIRAVPGAGLLHAEVVVTADYAAFVEYGTVRMAARPYLTPAAELVAARAEAVTLASLAFPSAGVGRFGGL